MMVYRPKVFTVDIKKSPWKYILDIEPGELVKLVNKLHIDV